jgi:iron-sulfur cluster assembly accessory protein
MQSFSRILNEVLAKLVFYNYFKIIHNFYHHSIMSIIVTDNAFKRVAELIVLENAPSALRITVDGGGCSGFIYNYTFISLSDVESDDYIVEKDGTKIIFDSISKQFMLGCIVDFVEELGSSYFAIKNPNAKTKCGCGNSFSV